MQLLTRVVICKNPLELSICLVRQLGGEEGAGRALQEHQPPLHPQALSISVMARQDIYGVHVIDTRQDTGLYVETHYRYQQI